jgi:hypothetical protein
MSISERWWLMGAFVVTLAGASVPTWRADGPHLEATAKAAARHRAPAHRETAEDAPLLSAPERPPTVARARPVRIAPPSLPAPEPEPTSVAIDVPDLPEPPPHAPLLWDEMFPAQKRPTVGANEPALAPCFDHLQGIEGFSPCPAVSPR